MATKSTSVTRRPVAKKSTARRKAKKGKKHNSSPLLHVVWIVLAVVAMILLFFVGKLVVDKAFNINAKYGEIVYPEGDVRGIDISHYQEDVDWDRLRNAELGGVPIRFIFIKATEGFNRAEAPPRSNPQERDHQQQVGSQNIHKPVPDHIRAFQLNRYGIDHHNG